MKNEPYPQPLSRESRAKFLGRVYAEILSWSATREDETEPAYSGLPQETEADSEDQINMTANKTARV